MLRARAGWVGRLLAGAAVLAAVVARAGDLEPPPEGLDPRAVSRRADQSLRGERTRFEALLTTRDKPTGEPDEIRLRLWDEQATQRCFVRILAPKGAAGTAFLKLPPNLWTYEPRDDRARRVRPAELKLPLLESEFRIDDLVRMTRLAEDYEVRLLGIDPAPDGSPGRRAYVLEYVRRDASPQLWSRIIASVDTEWGTPLRRAYYDEEGKLVRWIQFGDIRDVQGRYLPHVWTAHAAESGGRSSRIDVERFDLAPDIAGSTFTTRNLQPPE